MLLQEQRTVYIKVDVIQSSGLLLDSTVLDETWALSRASNKPLYAFALLWTSYSLSFGDSDSGHNRLRLCCFLRIAIFILTPHRRTFADFCLVIVVLTGIEKLDIWSRMRFKDVCLMLITILWSICIMSTCWRSFSECHCYAQCPSPQNWENKTSTAMQKHKGVDC